MNHRPVCVKCGIEFKPERNDVGVVDLYRNDTEPYKVWAADLWKCPICGVEIVVGFGLDALAEAVEGETIYEHIKWYEDKSRLIKVKETSY